MDQETIIRKRRKGDHAVPDIKEKQLVEPLQSGSLAHVQYTGIHVTLYTVFLCGYRRLDTLVITVLAC